MKKFVKTRRFVKRHSTTILTWVEVTGLILTTVSAIRDSFDAKEKIDKIKKEEPEVTKLQLVAKAIPCYKRTIACFGGTTLTIFAQKSACEKKINAINSMYILADRTYKDYRESLINLYGEEADEAVKEGVVRKYAEVHYPDSDVSEEKLCFVEAMTGSVLYRYEREIIDAEYHFNRNYILAGDACVNDFLEMLGIPSSDYWADYGWNQISGIYWVDFEHRLEEREDGKTVYIIEPIFPPDKNYMEDYNW